MRSSMTPDPLTATRYELKSGRLTSHGRLLEFLASFPRETRILDVGAATGYLGMALRARGFRHVSAIERDPEHAALATPYYEVCRVHDVEQEEWPEGKGAFDVVICADVLEHLRDPAAALHRLAQFATPGGWMLVSLPNVAHWSVRFGLLAGKFPYRDSGILDRTHLRFFTRASARELLRDGALTIVREDVTPLPFAHWCDGSPWTPLWRILERLDWWFARLRPTLCAYQFLFACRTRGASVLHAAERHPAYGRSAA